MQELTSYASTFEDLRNGNLLYIDKTEYLWKLIRPYTAGYFFARPRRFGKSLTLTTLKAIFEGKQTLFDGLAIAQKNYDWKPYPIIHLDLSTCDATSPRELKKFLIRLLAHQCNLHKIHIPLDEEVLSATFFDVITAVAESSRAVLLIDEYDKPILNNIENPELEEILSVLKGFYSAIKSCNDKIRFLFITGVSKFSQVSMFSGFNTPMDITMNWDYATMLGYTQNEVETYFAPYIQQACEKTGMTRKELLENIKTWYDGYCFAVNAESVYNPVSLIKFFTNHYLFENYWFATGTPSFLFQLARKRNFNIDQAIAKPLYSYQFDAYEPRNIDTLSLLFQTGYLTIKETTHTGITYRYKLDFPNKEVRDSFEIYLINDYTGIAASEVCGIAVSLQDALQRENFDELMEILKTFYAGIGYDVAAKTEGRYQLLFVALFKILGFQIDPESRTNIGRIDTALETKNKIYLFEFKVGQSAEIGMKQITDRQYYQKYLQSGKEILLASINFNTHQRQIQDWQIRRLPKS